MSTVTTTETALTDSLGARLRKTVIGAGFAVVLIVPKVLNLRRNERSWVAFRTVMGLFGAALVVLPIGFYSSYFLRSSDSEFLSPRLCCRPLKLLPGPMTKLESLALWWW